MSANNPEDDTGSDAVVIASFEGPDGYYELEVEDDTLYKVYVNDSDRPRETVLEGFGRWRSTTAGHANGNSETDPSAVCGNVGLAIPLHKYFEETETEGLHYPTADWTVEEAREHAKRYGPIVGDYEGDGFIMVRVRRDTPIG